MLVQNEVISCDNIEAVQQLGVTDKGTVVMHMYTYSLNINIYL